jgi:hypothetical protein
MDVGNRLVERKIGDVSAAAQPDQERGKQHAKIHFAPRSTQLAHSETMSGSGLGQVNGAAINSRT